MTFRDRQFLDSFQNKPCLVCTNDQGTVGHHIKTKGSGGPDEPWNIIPLCPKHHHETHLKGTVTFTATYSVVEKWMLANDWWFSGVKWKH